MPLPYYSHMPPLHKASLLQSAHRWRSSCDDIGAPRQRLCLRTWPASTYLPTSPACPAHAPARLPPCCSARLPAVLAVQGPEYDVKLLVGLRGTRTEVRRACACLAQTFPRPCAHCWPLCCSRPNYILLRKRYAFGTHLFVYFFAAGGAPPCPPRQPSVPIAARLPSPILEGTSACSLTPKCSARRTFSRHYVCCAELCDWLCALGQRRKCHRDRRRSAVAPARPRRRRRSRVERPCWWPPPSMFCSLTCDFVCVVRALGAFCCCRQAVVSCETCGRVPFWCQCESGTFLILMVGRPTCYI